MRLIGAELLLSLGVKSNRVAGVLQSSIYRVTKQATRNKQLDNRTIEYDMEEEMPNNGDRFTRHLLIESGLTRPAQLSM